MTFRWAATSFVLLAVLYQGIVPHVDRAEAALVGVLVGQFLMWLGDRPGWWHPWPRRSRLPELDELVDDPEALAAAEREAQS